MRFREFFFFDWIVVADFIAEAVSFKGNVSRDKNAVLLALNAHLERQAVGGAITPQLIVDTISHQFTTYDDEWQGIENNKAQYDLCDYIKAWNKCIQDTAALVTRFAATYLTTEQQRSLLPLNQAWVQSHLKPVPRQCEEEDEDDDPRQWRSGYKKR